MNRNMDIAAMTRDQLEAELEQVNTRLEATLKTLTSLLSAAFKDRSTANMKAMAPVKAAMTADEKRMRALTKALKPYLAQDKKTRAAR